MVNLPNHVCRQPINDSADATALEHNAMTVLTPTQLPDRPEIDTQALKLQPPPCAPAQAVRAGAGADGDLSIVRDARPAEHGRNPVMFLVEVGRILTAMVTIQSIATGAGVGLIVYQAALTVLLLLTVLFANFAEALAEARGKAQADSLRATRQDTPGLQAGAASGETIEISSTELKPGDRVVVEAGQIIPADGEIVVGVASVDESAITGESAPVIREAGGDRSGVTGGTRVLSDRIVVQVTAEPGESFLDRMIALVEGAIAAEDAQRDRADDRPGRVLDHLPDRHRDALPDGPLLRPDAWISPP